MKRYPTTIPGARRRRTRGTALIMALAVMAGLVAVLASLAASEHVAVQAQINREERSRALLACQSGIQRAIVTLAEIAAPGQSGQTSSTSTNSNANTTVSTSSQDDWAQLGQNSDERFLVGDLSFRLQVLDGSSFLNINTMSMAEMNLLPFTQNEIAAILDFRSAGTTPSALGAKDEYYTNLMNPYNCKEAPFETVDELLQVRDLTAQHLYEPRTDVTVSAPQIQDVNGNQLPLAAIFTAVSYSARLSPTGGNLINVNSTASGARLRTLLSPNVLGTVLARQNWTSLGQLCAIPRATTQDLSNILNYLSIGPPAARVSGLININTATQNVLQLLPGVTPDIASSIVNQQATGFTSLGAITTVSGVNGAVLSQIADLITANSQTFVVRVIGTAGSTSIPVEALIDVENGVPKILQMQEQPFNDMITRWGWDQDSTTDTVLKENS